jgi:small-conductance mechanosensitive channel
MICHCKEENRFQTERDLNRAYCLLFLNNGVDYPYNQLIMALGLLTHPQDAADPDQLASKEAQKVENTVLPKTPEK